MPYLREMNTPGIKVFDAVKAKYFRLVTRNPTWLSNIELHNGPRYKNWTAKTNYTAGASYEVDLQHETACDLNINSASILDLSSKMDADGNLHWRAPAGRWTILSIGHTTTGEENAAHPDSAKGLEIDKFSKKALDFHFNKFLNQLIDKLKIYKSFKGFTVDSWEAGKQNWTLDFPAEFRKKRGYDIMSWIPAVTGRIVGNSEPLSLF